MSLHVDINSDLGESFGRYVLGQDPLVLKLITSANIACGFHAGDPRVMYETVQLAHESGVQIGAHPGYPDLNGFGRRDMNLSPDEIYQLVIYQLGALQGFTSLFNDRVAHVKPHGSLYNRSSKDPQAARAIARAVADFDQKLILFGLAGGELVKAGQEMGLQVAQEVFADRNYQPDGTLRPRNQPGALIHDSQIAVKRVIRMIKEGRVKAFDGQDIQLVADTICVHGDGANALEFVQELRRGLEKEGITIQAVGEPK